MRLANGSHECQESRASRQGRHSCRVEVGNIRVWDSHLPRVCRVLAILTARSLDFECVWKDIGGSNGPDKLGVTDVGIQWASFKAEGDVIVVAIKVQADLITIAGQYSCIHNALELWDFVIQATIMTTNSISEGLLHNHVILPLAAVVWTLAEAGAIDAICFVSWTVCRRASPHIRKLKITTHLDTIRVDV